MSRRNNYQRKSNYQPQNPFIYAPAYVVNENQQPYQVSAQQPYQVSAQQPYQVSAQQPNQVSAEHPHQVSAQQQQQFVSAQNAFQQQQFQNFYGQQNGSAMYFPSQAYTPVSYMYARAPQNVAEFQPAVVPKVRKAIEMVDPSTGKVVDIFGAILKPKALQIVDPITGKDVVIQKAVSKKPIALKIVDPTSGQEVKIGHEPVPVSFAPQVVLAKEQSNGLESKSQFETILEKDAVAEACEVKQEKQVDSDVEVAEECKVSEIEVAKDSEVKVAIESKDSEVEVAQESKDSEVVVAEESKDSEVEVAQESKDSEVEVAKESKDSEVEVAEESKDSEVEVAEESKDSEVEVAEESKDSEVEVAKESKDSEVEVTKDSEVKVAIEFKDSEVEVAQESKDSEVVVAEESKDSEVEVAKESKDSEVEVAEESKDSEVEVAKESKDSEVEVAEESKNSEVEVAKESKDSEVEVAEESKDSEVEVAQESKDSEVEVAKESKDSEVEVAEESKDSEVEVAKESKDSEFEVTKDSEVKVAIEFKDSEVEVAQESKDSEVVVAEESKDSEVEVAEESKDSEVEVAEESKDSEVEVAKESKDSEVEVAEESKDSEVEVAQESKDSEVEVAKESKDSEVEVAEESKDSEVEVAQKSIEFETTEKSTDSGEDVKVKSADLELSETSVKSDESDVKIEIQDEEKSTVEKSPLKAKLFPLPGQWTPQNPDGKKTYSREYLMQILNSMVMVKPNLPNIDIVLNQPTKQLVRSETTMPHDYQMPARGQRNHGSGYSNRHGNADRAAMEPRRVIERQAPVSLHKAEEAWKGGSKNQLSDTEAMLNSLKSILNKLTPQNFNKLVDKVKELPINSEDRLSGCISLLFEKAVLEPNFSATYAGMAKCLILWSVPSNADESKPVTFRKLLLNKCQEEFEKDKEDQKSISVLEEKIEKSTTPEEKKLLTEEKTLAVFKAKQRSLGNIRFIGELFKLKMLTEKIMQECLLKLIRSQEDEENIEFLCKLMATIGKDLDLPKSKKFVDTLFEQMKAFVDQKKFSKRMRFIILDLADLRKAAWVPKRDNAPKTIEEIHKEALKEQQSAPALVNTPRHQNQPVPRRAPQPKPVITEDAWHTVTKVPQPQALEPAKLKLTALSLKEGPRLGGQRKEWSKGAGTSGKVQASQPVAAAVNRYSLLYGNDEPEEPVVEVPKKAAKPLAPVARAKLSSVETKTPTLKDEKKTVEAVTMPREKLERKTKALIDEYLSLKDIQEATECVKELEVDRSSVNCFRFFDISIKHVLEKSSAVRTQVGTLHRSLMQNNVIPSTDAYATALCNLARNADDMSLDVPKIWDCLGEIALPVYQELSFSLEMLFKSETKVLDPEEEEIDEEFDNDDIARLMATILKKAKENKGEACASEIWARSNQKWDEIVKKNPVEEFLAKYVN